MILSLVVAIAHRALLNIIYFRIVIAIAIAIENLKIWSRVRSVIEELNLIYISNI